MGEKLAELLRAASTLPGAFDGAFSGMRVYHTPAPGVKKPVIYPPSVVVVAQGGKMGYLAGRHYPYGAGQLLIIAAPLPVECQVVKAPYLSIAIPLVESVLRDLIRDLGLDPSGTPQSSIGVFRMNDLVEEAATRVARVAASSEETVALGEAALREFYYRLLQGPEAHPVLSLLANRGREIECVLSWIHSHLDEAIKVEELAERASMSAATFHRAFKAQTGMSPLQYAKTLRLHKAYSLIHYDGRTVSQAAHEVGYGSSSQFSREFKRLYGEPPSEFSRRARGRILD